MKTLSGAEYKIVRLSPKDMVPGTKFGHELMTDLEALTQFTAMPNNQYTSRYSESFQIWTSIGHGMLFPTHPLEGMCLDGVER